MRNIPSLPQPQSLPEDMWEVGHVEPLRISRPVSDRTMAPQLVYHHKAAETPHFANPEQEFAERRINGDRRKYCRRTEQEKTRLLDTRSETERRHINRRRNDVRTSIEEEI